MALVRALVYGNIWIAFGSSAWIAQSFLLQDKAIDWSLVILVGVATFWIYNLDRMLAYKYFERGESERHLWLHRNKSFLVLSSIIPTFILFGYLFILDINKLIYLAHLGIVSILYAVPILSAGIKKRPLREVSILKIFLISYVWAACTSSLAIKTNLMDIFIPDVFFAERFLFIFAITLAFDIRDANSDRDFGLTTIPNKIGSRNSKILGFILLLIYAVICINVYSDLYSQLIFLITAFLALVLLVKAKEGGRDIYFTGLIDGLLLLQGILFYLYLA